MCWIDNGEQGNHGMMGLGVFVWSGIDMLLIEIRDGSEVSRNYESFVLLLSRGGCRLLTVGPSVAGCIEN